MRKLLTIGVFLICPLLALGQTAAELVQKNLEARGGIENIKAIKTMRMTARLQQGGFQLQIMRLSMAPNLMRDAYTIQGMSQIVAYDGSQGWQISPFQGRKDPELLGEDQTRDVVEDADFYGPLIDYATKDNRIEYMGHDTVDGDDAYRLKVTLANGDVIYYFLDPDTYLEIRTEKMEFVRGAVHQSATNLGSYKKVNGVYFPFSLEQGGLFGDSSNMAKITVDKIEANIRVDPAEFKMPVVKPAASKGGN